MSATLATRLRASLGAEVAGGELRPRSREELRRAVELCVEARQALTPCGGGDPRPGSLALRTRGWSGVVDLWRDDLVLRVAAGTTLGELDAELAPLGLRSGVDADGGPSATVGGAFARGERGRYGETGRALRERTLGLLAVDGRARLLRGGGRVVKNVAGHDLVRLHHGAHGALGVLVDLVLRVEAIPAAALVAWLPCPRGEREARLAALRRPAAGLEPVGQWWCDEARAAAAGLPGEGLLFVVEGGPGGVEAWRRQAGSELRELDWPAGLLRVDEGELCDLLGGPRPDLATGGPVAARLKDSFDPHGLLPPLPGSEA